MQWPANGIFDLRILLAAVMLQATAIVALSAALPQAAAAADARCEAWDSAAAGALAVALTDPSQEWRLGDAVFRLRRARRNCKAGWTDLARLDYEAITNGRYGRSR